MKSASAAGYALPDSVRVLASKVVDGNAANARYQGTALGNLHAGSKAGQRRETGAGTLALVITVRVGANLRICAAQELVVRCGAHARDFQSWRLRFGRDRWRRLP